MGRGQAWIYCVRPHLKLCFCSTLDPNLIFAVKSLTIVAKRSPGNETEEKNPRFPRGPASAFSPVCEVTLKRDLLDLSIIIVNWNTRGLLEKCLRAVYGAAQGLAFEVFVVDNASTDGSPAMVRQRFPRVRLIENRANLGFARASNQAIRAGRGRCVLLLNSDAFLTSQAVRHLLGCLQADGQIGIAGAALVDSHGRPQPSHGRLPSLPSEVLSLFGLDKLLSNPSSWVLTLPRIETGWVSGACLLARRSMLDQIGLLDESFFLFGEEVDLCCRARLAGWKVAHLPAARVVHIGGGSTGVNAQRILLLYRGKLRYFEKHFGRRVARRLWAAMGFTALCKLCLYSLLRLLSLGKVRKDALWRGVAGGRTGVQA